MKWKLIRGEALGALAQMETASVDAVVTDPPYSSGGQFRGDRMQPTVAKYQPGTHQVRAGRPNFSGDNRDQRSFAYWSTLWLTEALRVAKPGAALLAFTDWRQLPTMTDAIQAGGWVWRGIVPWDKTEGTRPKLGGFRSQAEYVVWATNGPIVKDLAEKIGYLPGAFRFSVRQVDKFHQTGKPTALMEQLVRVCPPGGVVLDPFAGSGTTLVAAIKSGRRAVGVEMVPEIADVAERRLTEAAGASAAA